MQTLQCFFLHTLMVVFLLKERKIVFLYSQYSVFVFFFSKLITLKHFLAPRDMCIASAHQSPFSPTSISSILLVERGAVLP